MIGAMEILINIANILYILSYFVQDLLRIRLLTVVGATVLVVYFAIQPEPIMTIIYWNTFFVLLNIFQIGRIVRERQTGVDPVATAATAMKKLLSKLVTASRQTLGTRTTLPRNSGRQKKQDLLAP